MRDIMILFSSSAIRSFDIMLMRSLLRAMASEGVGFEEAQLSRKADTTHHAQGIVGKSDVGVEWGTGQILQVVHSIEWINQFSKTALVQT